ncbi:MAG TPA: alkyl sulfatase dimerization domain-containing protein [Actinomycetota bacterium]|nr:alkyl sulfatase dimerization domain-containing protein [Actinomycetota bacterium]
MSIASFFGGSAPARLARDTLFIPSFANAAALLTSDGVVLVDCGHELSGPAIHAAVRAFTDAPLHTVVYTHGHVDHVGGWGPWEAEGADPRVVAHEAVHSRFDRYLRTPGLNEHINRVQFGVEGVRWPRAFRRPDITYRTSLDLEVGGETLHLHHARGETDDATWLWAPDRGVLCTGDLWISSVPNCGNPQKVQRYPDGWADALEVMAGLRAEVLLPGHGPAIEGADTVRSALLEVCGFLRSIVEQTLDLLNAGVVADEIPHRVRIPDVADSPYLAPIYDRPEFIIRNVIRLYGGWWNGRPADLLPAPASSRAREIARLAGGVGPLVARARELAATDLPLACHLAEWALLADPGSAEAQSAVRDLFARRAEEETSLMGQGIYRHAVREAEAALGSAQDVD